MVVARTDDPEMKKRALTAFLWFYAAWFTWAMFAPLVGLSESVGPIIGLAAAALIAGDPRRIIWTGGTRRRSEPAS